MPRRFFSARSFSILSIRRGPTSLRYQGMPYIVLSRCAWASISPGSISAPPPSTTGTPEGASAPSAWMRPSLTSTVVISPPAGRTWVYSVAFSMLDLY